METVTLNSFAALTLPLAGVHKETGLIVRSDGYVLSPAGNWLEGNADPKTDKRIPYRRITIYKGGSKRRYMVHRLVAETFLKNSDNKPTVDHIDRDSLNNSVFNLRWATYKEQCKNRSTSLHKQSREERINKQREYKKANRVEIRSKSREYYCKNKERILARMKNHRKKKELTSRPVVFAKK